MPTLASPEPPTTLDEESDEESDAGEDTEDDSRIEDDLNQYRECRLCDSVESEMLCARDWQHVSRGPHSWVPKDICERLGIHFDTDLPTGGGYFMDDRGWSSLNEGLCWLTSDVGELR